ncbi:MAG: deoxyguanosinetriphosphate triphosphohydrolase [Verrucomicrobiota bacterium]|nr:deoxyguanosinetriphosphate triphosphohydrolase [Verrucomicrobiota bacterium]MDE3068258.1 deoxyguanosinetriphosphate triphosphohydrolase [Verrucomicrobiota bacterium]
MPRTRQELEQIERQTLAPCAQFSGDSRGRRHAEPPPQWRTHYQRDRDRVIHSRAFRRLEYKTQVFLNGSGDHLRTRLTHTIEVAAVARNMASALRLNSDLAETIALAHDLGHSPFGHTGETALARLMKGHGGFEHNRHSLRLVEELEQKYPGFSGLNLSWEVREGLAKHRTSYDYPGRRTGFDAKNASLEAQVANLADEITYYSHDLDDGLDSGLLSEKDLFQKVRVWARAARFVKREHGRLPDECRRYFIIRTVIDLQIHDVVETSEPHIRRAGVRSADDVRRFPKALVQYSPGQRRLNLQLRDYLYKNLYYNPVVHEPNRRAAKMLEQLFGHYLKHPDEIGKATRRRVNKAGLHRTVCDYLAGMTDRYVLLEHRRIFGGTFKAA